MEISDTATIDGISGETGVDTANDTGESFGIVEPNGATNPSTSAKPRGRGRPAGSNKRSGSDSTRSGSGKSSTSEKKTSIFVDKELLGRQLVGLHAMAAMMLKEPIIAIESAEGEALAKSFIDLSEHYGLTASRGVMLWVNLAGTAAMIYGSKIITIAKRPKQPKQNAQTSNVTPLQQAGVMNYGG